MTLNDLSYSINGRKHCILKWCVCIGQTDLMPVRQIEKNTTCRNPSPDSLRPLLCMNDHVIKICLFGAKYLVWFGDSLVFIFPLATMLTFTSAVGKLNVRVLWHHHMLLQVISQSYCQVFVKSYNFVFEQIDQEGSPP